MSNHAYTQEFPSKTLRLISNVRVIHDGKYWETKALWDTGATISCIATCLVKEIGLPVHSEMILSSVTNDERADQYRVTVMLSSANVMLKDLLVASKDIDRQGIGFIIGMDIISKGDFALFNAEDKSVLTVRFPSQGITDSTKDL